MKFVATLIIAVATLFITTSQESHAQFHRGGSGFSIGFGSFGGGGFNRGFGGFNSFNRGFGGSSFGFGGSSFNRGFGGGFGRPVYRSYRPVYGGGFNSFGGGFGRGCGY